MEKRSSARKSTKFFLLLLVAEGTKKIKVLWLPMSEIFPSDEKEEQELFTNNFSVFWPNFKTRPILNLREKDRTHQGKQECRDSQLRTVGSMCP